MPNTRPAPMSQFDREIKAKLQRRYDREFDQFVQSLRVGWYAFCGVLAALVVGYVAIRLLG